MEVIDVIWHGIRDALLMAWEVWWALVLGFGISAAVQAWVPRERVQRALGAGGPSAMTQATLLGAASSSCSYAAVAIGRALMQKGASVASALAFQFASTNLVWELGLVLWVLIGWQFTVAEYLGGIVMIALMGLGLRWFVSRDVEREARTHLEEPAGADHCGHAHDHDHAAGGDAGSVGWRERVASAEGWRAVARTFRADWSMLGREIVIGFGLAGFVGQVPDSALRALFVHNAPAPLPAIENAAVGPVIAVLSFVCSVGNVPLAAVLWSGGIGFSGVLAFLFADLIVLPIVAIYRKTYGGRFAARIVALMFVTMVVAALAISGLFDLLGWIPRGARPSRADVFGAVRVDYKLALNLVATAIFLGLWALTIRGRGRRAKDTVARHTLAHHH